MDKAGRMETNEGKVSSDLIESSSYVGRVAPFATSGSLDAADSESSVQQAIARADDYLKGEQHADGYWCGELEGDTILESEYILLLAWLGREDSIIARKAAEYIIEQQLPTGGWALFPGGDVEISGSVKAYFALKLTGHDSNAEYMQRARKVIMSSGGADSVNSFTRFYLALLSQISYEYCPAVPPEAVLLPAWFPTSIYRISAWSRTILVPLSIMWAHRPSRQLTAEKGIRELFIKEPDHWPRLRCPGLRRPSGFFSWETLFHRVDRMLKWCERWRIKPLRKRALAAAKEWMLERFANSDGLGAIFPPIIWSVVALRCLGYEEDSEEVVECMNQLDALTIEEEKTARLQPCKSPVWDTALSLRGLAAAGASSQDNSIRRATAWLLQKEVKQCGDWSKKVKAEPSGWFFEHRNAFYPDVDDTIMVMMALADQLDERCEDGQQRNIHGESINSADKDVRVSQARTRDVEEARRVIPSLIEETSLSYPLSDVADACERGRRWVLALQNSDGGWGAFDKDNDAEFLCHVPFADHNAMIDPSTPDITGRVLEALGRLGMSVGHSSVDRAVDYVRKTQEPDGCWIGRWGVNYIYGTWQVLAGLREVGVPASSSVIQNGADWLVSHQQPCGGWGETAVSYAYPELRGQGPVTPSQTAWAVWGLIAAGMSNHSAVEKGIQWLLKTQRADGGWAEDQFTGTGFPQVFYLKYHLYPIYFPLLALAKWRRTIT